MRHEAGFTLVECLCALALLAIVVTGTMAALMSQASSNTASEQRTEAAAAAEQVLELIRLDDPALMPASGPGTPRAVELNNREYEVTPRYCTRPQFCGERARHLLVEVRLDGRLVFDVETVFTQLR